VKRGIVIAIVVVFAVVVYVAVQVTRENDRRARAGAIIDRMDQRAAEMDELEKRWLESRSEATTRNVAGSTTKSRLPEGFTLHRSAERSVAISVPSSWVSLPAATPTVLHLMDPGSGAQVNVTAGDSLPGETLESAMEALKSGLPSQYEDVRFRTTDYVTINGHRAARLVFESSRGGDRLVMMMVALIKAPTSYVITCSAAPPSFGDLDATFQLVLESFEIP
jgi:hypothetical protein